VGVRRGVERCPTPRDDDDDDERNVIDRVATSPPTRQDTTSERSSQSATTVRSNGAQRAPRNSTCWFLHGSGAFSRV